MLAIWKKSGNREAISDNIIETNEATTNTNSSVANIAFRRPTVRKDFHTTSLNGVYNNISTNETPLSIKNNDEEKNVVSSEKTTPQNSVIEGIIPPINEVDIETSFTDNENEEIIEDNNSTESEDKENQNKKINLQEIWIDCIDNLSNKNIILQLFLKMIPFDIIDNQKINLHIPNQLYYNLIDNAKSELIELLKTKSKLDIEIILSLEIPQEINIETVDMSDVNQIKKMMMYDNENIHLLQEALHLHVNY